MVKPGEHKTVQARILEYAEAIGWTVVPRGEAERRRGFDPDAPLKDRAKVRSLFFDDLLDARVREFNPRANIYVLIDEAHRTAEALAALLKEVESNETRKKEQAEKSFDGLTYFVPNHGRLWKSLMRAHLGNYETSENKLRQIQPANG